MLLASRVLQGHTVPLFEFPVAPLDKASFAVLRSCAAPEALPADAWRSSRSCSRTRTQPPFRRDCFDTVLTPWYVDIIPQDFVDCVRNVNRLLAQRRYLAQHGIARVLAP